MPPKAKRPENAKRLTKANDDFRDDAYFEEEPQPVFDLKRYRMKDTRIIGRLQLRMQAATNENDVYLVDEQMDRLCEHLCRFVVSVPEEWLAEGHPAELDWNDAESFDWLGHGRFSELIVAMANAQPNRQKK